MVRVGRSAVGLAVVTAAVGCSLLTPLDYVGGTVEQAGGADAAGRSGDGGTGTAGRGSGAEGGSDVTGGRGGTEGGGPGVGGSGPQGGESGAGGESGSDPGGNGGLGGSSGAGDTNGGVGGGAGTGVAGADAGGAGIAGGAGCPGVDLEADPTNCGMCGLACEEGEECLQGACAGSPCDGLCATFVNVPPAGDGFRADNIGTAEQCFEVLGYVRNGSEPALVCWNFDVERTLEVNGKPIGCELEPGASVGDPRVGGYCLKAGAGEFSYAGFKFPLP